MFRLVSRETERMKGYGMKSAAQVAALLASEPEPYYGEMKELARQVREHYALVSPSVRCSELRKIYRHRESDSNFGQVKCGTYEEPISTTSWE